MSWSQKTLFAVLCTCLISGLAGGEAPVADFFTNTTTGLAPLTVSFNDTSINNPTSWNWSFGDATWFNTSVETERNATHQYIIPGTYTVSLTVSNEDGSDTTLPGTAIIVTIPAPAVSSITPSQGMAGEIIPITALVGTNFYGTPFVNLTNSSVNITAAGVTVASDSTITCSVDLTSAAAGSWDVIVTNPDGQEGILEDGFFVNPPLERYLFVTEWGSEGSGNGQFRYPEAIAVDSQNNVYVADYLNYRIQKFDSNGTYLSQWGGFNEVRGVCVDENDFVYATDHRGNLIKKFDTEGTLLNQWPVAQTGDYVNWAYQISVDRNGMMFVNQPFSRGFVNGAVVQKYSQDLGFIGEWDSGDRAFNAAHGTVVDEYGDVYIADEGNGIIQKCSNNGEFIESWSTTGVNGEGIGAHQLGVDYRGHVFVADSGVHKILKYSLDGHLLAEWGSFGTDPGQFDQPRGIAIDREGNVYVADYNNHRIQKFRPEDPVQEPQKTLLTINSSPAGASITIDGLTTGQYSSSTFSNIEPGRHKIRLQLAGYAPYTRVIFMPIDETTTLEAILQPAPFINAINWSPSNPNEGSGIRFNATVSTPPGYTIDGYLWTYGNESEVIEMSPAEGYTSGVWEIPASSVIAGKKWVDCALISNGSDTVEIFLGDPVRGNLVVSPPVAGTNSLHYTDFPLVPQSPSRAVYIRSIDGDRGYDPDNDGRYENLLVRFTVTNTGNDGNYTISGALSDSNGNIIDTVVDHTFLLGDGAITPRFMYFNGEEIFEHRANGPYTLEGIKITRDDEVLDIVYSVYQTQGYSFYLFSDSGDSMPAPTVSGITPNAGTNTTTIRITNLSGSNFPYLSPTGGPTVNLTRNGYPNITASDVNIISPSQLNCSFDLTGKATGRWNIVVTNPDGQSGMLPDGFTIAGTTRHFAVFRPSASNNWIFTEDLSTVKYRDHYGIATDKPLVGDFNNDGIMDRAVFRNGNWIVDWNMDGSVNSNTHFGVQGDIPVVAYFNNDRITDRAVFRNGWWIVDWNMDGSVDIRTNYGTKGDIPFAGDINLDGTPDRAVFRNGWWIIDLGMDGIVDSRGFWGLSSDIPLMGWIDGNTVMDRAVFRNGEWVMDYNMDGSVNWRPRFGTAGDKPLSWVEG